MSCMDLDRVLIGNAVKMLMRRDRDIGTWPGLERASGVARATLYRVEKGHPRVSAATLQRVEAALGLPTDTLQTLGMHRWDDLAVIGAPDYLIDWARRSAGN